MSSFSSANAPHQRAAKRSAFLCENGAPATRTKRRVALRVRWMRLLGNVFSFMLMRLPLPRAFELRHATAIKDHQSPGNE